MAVGVGVDVEDEGEDRDHQHDPYDPGMRVQKVLEPSRLLAAVAAVIINASVHLAPSLVGGVACIPSGASYRKKITISIT